MEEIDARQGSWFDAARDPFSLRLSEMNLHLGCLFRWGFNSAQVHSEYLPHEAILGESLDLPHV